MNEGVERFSRPPVESRGPGRLPTDNLSAFSLLAPLPSCRLGQGPTMTAEHALNGEHRPTDLIRALAAIARTQQLWLEDLGEVCAGDDPRFQEAFRRWQELLAMLRLHLLRAEQRLLNYLLLPDESRDRADHPGDASRYRDAHRRWDQRIQACFGPLHLDTRYRRIDRVLDLDDDGIVADVTTDLANLAALAESTGSSLDRVHEAEAGGFLQDLAFFHVISPWKIRGRRTLADVQRWLDEFLEEDEEL